MFHDVLRCEKAVMSQSEQHREREDFGIVYHFIILLVLLTAKYEPYRL